MKRNTVYATGLILLTLVIVLLTIVVKIAGAEQLVSGDLPNPPSDHPTEQAGQTAQTPTEVPEEFATATLAVAGDIVIHEGILTEANDNGVYDFKPLFDGASDIIAGADYAVTCMETSLPEGMQYVAYPMFRSPASLAGDLKSLGFDMVSLANNHALDSWVSGLKQTMETLSEAELEYVGAAKSQAERDVQNGIKFVEVNGIKIAFLAFTYGTNGMPLEGENYVINVFFSDHLSSQRTIDYDMLKRDMAAARASDADIIAVFMHWGYEYQTVPANYQNELADFLFTEGADLILGGHPHAPQPVEMREIVNTDGSRKTGFICYSPGNFISTMNDKWTRINALFEIELEKNLSTGEAYIKDMHYSPMYMLDTRDFGLQTAGFRYKLIDMHKALDSYAKGDDLGYMNDALRDELLYQLELLHSVVDGQYDKYMTA